MTRVAYKREVAPGEVLIKEGDLFATEFYIVAKGNFVFNIANRNGSEHDKLFQMSLMRNCKAGGSFGEVALLYHCQREATVTCSEPAVFHFCYYPIVLLFFFADFCNPKKSIEVDDLE